MIGPGSTIASEFLGTESAASPLFSGFQQLVQNMVKVIYERSFGMIWQTSLSFKLRGMRTVAQDRQTRML
jgi:hypothetical protein